MRGHWLSNTRKLNHHYQSGNGFNVMAYDVFSTLQRGSYGYIFGTNYLPLAGIPSGASKQIVNDKITLRMYADFTDVTDKNNLEWVYAHDTNIILCAIQLYDGNNNLIATPIIRMNNTGVTHNLQSELLDYYDVGIGYNTRTLYKISKRKNNPSEIVYNVDRTQYPTAQYFKVVMSAYVVFWGAWHGQPIGTNQNSKAYVYYNVK